MKIFKYKLSLAEETEIEVPFYSNFCHVAKHNNDFYLWINIANHPEKIKRTFSFFATGEQINEDYYTYCGTVIDDEFVWHLHEKEGL